MLLTMSAKCSDMFSCHVARDGETIADYQGYVPDFFPGEHFGDYVEFEIDTDTGQIMNWRKPTVADIKALAKGF